MKKNIKLVVTDIDGTIMKMNGKLEPEIISTFKALQEKNIQIECDYTLMDFVEKTLQYAKTKGVGMRLMQGGGEDA